MSRRAFIAGYMAGERSKSAQWYLDDAFREPDTNGINAPASFFENHVDGYSRGGGWWQTRKLGNGLEINIFEPRIGGGYEWSVCDSKSGDVLAASVVDDAHWWTYELREGETFQEAVEIAEAWVRDNL